MDRFTLVPREFFDPADSKRLLSELVQLDQNDTIQYTELPEYGAVLVYCNALPVVHRLFGLLAGISEDEKVVISYDGASLSLVVARGADLLLANCFEAADFATALYFVAASLEQFAMKPEEIVLRYSGDMQYDWQEMLYKYFKGILRVA